MGNFNLEPENMGRRVIFLNHNSVNVPAGVSGKISGTRQNLNTLQTIYEVCFEFPLIKCLDVYYKDLDVSATDMCHPVYQMISWVECDRGDFKVM